MEPSQISTCKNLPSTHIFSDVSNQSSFYIDTKSLDPSRSSINKSGLLKSKVSSEQELSRMRAFSLQSNKESYKNSAMQSLSKPLAEITEQQQSKQKQNSMEQSIPFPRDEYKRVEKLSDDFDYTMNIGIKELQKLLGTFNTKVEQQELIKCLKTVSSYMLEGKWTECRKVTQTYLNTMITSINNSTIEEM